MIRWLGRIVLALMAAAILVMGYVSHQDQHVSYELFKTDTQWTTLSAYEGCVWLVNDLVVANKRSTFQPSFELGRWQLISSVQGPLRVTLISFPFWFPAFVLLLVWGGLFGFHRIRRARRHRKGLCVHCAYDLTGNDSGICSECGINLAPSEPIATFVERFFIRWTPRMAVLSLSILTVWLVVLSFSTYDKPYHLRYGTPVANFANFGTAPVEAKQSVLKLENGVLALDHISDFAAKGTPRTWNWSLGRAMFGRKTESVQTGFTLPPNFTFGNLPSQTPTQWANIKAAATPTTQQVVTWSIHVPLWFLALLCALWPGLIILRKPLRRWRHRRKGVCGAARVQP